MGESIVEWDILKNINTSAKHYVEISYNGSCCKNPDLLSLELITGHRYESDDLFKSDKICEISKLLQGAILQEKKKMRFRIGNHNRLTKLKEILFQLSSN